MYKMPKPKWGGTVDEIREKGWKHFHEPKKDDGALLDTIQKEGKSWWDWESDYAVGLAEGGDDTAKIKKKVNAKRKYYKDDTVKVGAKVKAQKVKADIYVAPVKQTKEMGVQIKLQGEQTLQTERTKWREELLIWFYTHPMEFERKQFDPRLLLCSIYYPKFNTRIMETAVSNIPTYTGQTKGNTDSDVSISGWDGYTIPSAEHFNRGTYMFLGKNQGGVQRIYPYGPPKRDDPTTWGLDSRNLKVSHWESKPGMTGYMSDENYELSFNQGPDQIKLDPGTLELTDTQFTQLTEKYKDRRDWFYQLLPTRKSIDGAEWLGLEDLENDVEAGQNISKITMPKDERYESEVYKDYNWVWSIGSKGGKVTGEKGLGTFSGQGGTGRKESWTLDLPVNQTGGIRQLPPKPVFVHKTTGMVYMIYGDRLDYLGSLKYTISSVTGAPTFENDSILLKKHFETDRTHLGEKIYINHILNLRPHRYIDIAGKSYGVSSGINMRIDHLTFRTQLGPKEYHEKAKKFYRKHYIHQEVTIEEKVNKLIEDYVEEGRTDINSKQSSLKRAQQEEPDIMEAQLMDWEVPPDYQYVSPESDEYGNVIDVVEEPAEEPEPQVEEEPAEEQTYEEGGVTYMGAPVLEEDNPYTPVMIQGIQYFFDANDGAIYNEEYDPVGRLRIGNIEYFLSLTDEEKLDEDNIEFSKKQRYIHKQKVKALPSNPLSERVYTENVGMFKKGAHGVWNIHRGGGSLWASNDDGSVNWLGKINDNEDISLEEIETHINRFDTLEGATHTGEYIQMRDLPQMSYHSNSPNRHETMMTTYRGILRKLRERQSRPPPTQPRKRVFYLADEEDWVSESDMWIWDFFMEPENAGNQFIDTTTVISKVYPKYRHLGVPPTNWYGLKRKLSEEEWNIFKESEDIPEEYEDEVKQNITGKWLSLFEVKR